MLYSLNVRALNFRAVSVVQYGAGIIEWRKNNCRQWIARQEDC